MKKAKGEILKKGQKEEGCKRYDRGKLRFDLIPEDVMEKLAEVYTHGASKYNDENWRKGMSWKRMIGPIKRHFNKACRGQDIDIDSGCIHLAQVIWGCMSLIHYQLQGIGKDDRVKDMNDKTLQIRPGNKKDIEKQIQMFWDIVEYWEKQNEG